MKCDSVVEYTREGPRRKLLKAGLSLAVLAGNCPPSGASEGASELPIADWRHCLGLTAIEVRSDPADKAQAVIFFDPFCPFCADLWKRLYADGSPHKGVSTRWVPVAYMSPRSSETIATLLANRSARMLAQILSAKDVPDAKVKRTPQPVSAEVREILDRNYRTWERLGGATPTIVFLSKVGKVVKQIGLLPERELATMVASWPQARLGEFK